MATSYQPLLSSSHRNSHSKALYIFICMAAIVGSIALASIWIVSNNSSESSLKSSVCRHAYDPPSCMAVVSSAAANTAENDGVGLLRMVLHSSLSRIQDAIELSNVVIRQINDGRAQTAMNDCVELMDLSLKRIMDSMVALRTHSAQARSDAHTWLSSVLTNHDTCLDGLYDPARSIMEPMIKDLISQARSSLGVLVAVAPSEVDDLRPLNGEFPSWLSPSDRRFLQTSPDAIEADVVVAKDDSGDYKTLKEAVDAAPKHSKRFVIYIKKGTYEENVEIKKENITIVGDGMDATIITGSLNHAENISTFRTATVAATGDRFIAQDICFQNTAGPEGDQAVALRIGADKSAINRCKMDAYQDTLYVHSNRQFYRDCYITGTVDFIFGNAAVVIQNSKVVARKPLSYQKNMVTAQKREDLNQCTGISVQNCDVTPSSDLNSVKGTIKTYLGRPWRNYSRTVFMESYLDDHIDPAGWSPWDQYTTFDTLYYGEYMNSGPGADTSKRVEWPGYHIITDRAEAMKFTVAQFIQGDVWLKNTGVDYNEGLYN